MIATIVFFLIVGTIVLGIGLDLGYRVWRAMRRRRAAAPTAVAAELPVDDA